MLERGQPPTGASEPGGETVVERDHVERIGWWCGIVAPILLLAGFFSIDDGENVVFPDDPINALVEDVVANTGRIVGGSLVGMIGALLLVWFGSSLRTRFGRQGDWGLMTGLSAYGFIVVMTAGAFLHGAFRLSLTTVNDRGILAEAMRPLAMLESVGMDVFSWGAIGLVLAMSMGSFGIQLVPKAMAVIGVLLSVAAIAFTPTSRGGFGVALLPWILIASALLLRRGRSPQGPTEGG